MTARTGADATPRWRSAAERLGQIAAALLALAIVVLSVVPPGLRPVAASQSVEHLSVFLALGAAFGLSTPGRPRLQVIAVLGFTVAVELIQMVAPGRHARLSDLVVDSVGALLGLAVAAAVHRIARRNRTPAVLPGDAVAVPLDR